MKKFFLTIFLVSFAFQIHSQSDPALKWLHPQPQGNHLKWVKMINENVWYMGGEYGAFLKTTNGGQSFTTHNNAGWMNRNYPGTLTYWHSNAAWFFDENNAILVGANSAGILKTTNGGSSFDTIPILPTGTGTLNNVYFVNQSLGFICGNTTWGVRKTTDGGLTWEQLSGLTSGTYYDVYASDASNILAFSDLSRVYKSTNGGASWALAQLPGSYLLYDAEFINPDTGVVVGSNGLFQYTTNGGATWQGNFPTNRTFYSVTTVGNEIVAAGFPEDSVYQTTNFGATWVPINCVGSGTYYLWGKQGIDKINSTIVTVGLYGTILKSVDDGHTWAACCQKVSDASFTYSLYVNPNTKKIISQGYLTPIPGSIFYSNDFGQSWSTGNFLGADDNRMRNFQMLNDNFGYGCGDYGKFWKTTNSGIDFTQIPVPPAGQYFMNNMDFLNQNVGWVVGGYPGTFQESFIAKTTDGGATWTNQTPSPNPMRYFIHIDMVDTSIGYFVTGGVGEIYKTTNGGLNWTPMIVPGATGNFIRIKAFDANNVYATCYLGSFFKTTDGGTNWTEVLPPVQTGSLFGSYWLDKNNGVQVGTLGLIEKTSNGGQSWTIMNAGGWTVYGAYMSHPDSFWVSAGYGQVFRYAAAVVPVELSSFLANVNGSSVTLRWSTATEKNNRGFAIERSEDFNNWLNLGFIEGKGTTTQTTNYSFVDKNVTNGTYYYRIKQIDYDGTYQFYYLGSEIEVGAPGNFSLSQNYPNPFNPATTIKFSLAKQSKTKLQLFNSIGELVATLIDEIKPAGNYELPFDASNLSSGVYIYKLSTDEASFTKKMTLIK